jgi:hypothetical protein
MSIVHDDIYGSTSEGEEMETDDDEDTFSTHRCTVFHPSVSVPCPSTPLRWDSRAGTRPGARVPGLEMPWNPGTALL